MAKPQKPPASLKDFDYFTESEVLPPNLAPGLLLPQIDPDLALLRSRYQRMKYRQLGWLLTVWVVLTFTAWFLWGYRDAAAYAFAPGQEPLLLGDVTELLPEQIPHNAYVQIHGITEHRGMRQKVLRSLGLWQQEYWYFRLLGSRGVFVEVAPHTDNIGPTTEITVRGRAVDPQRLAVYSSFVHHYLEIFNAQEHGEQSRIIQVDVLPGNDQLRYGVAFGVLLLIAVVNIWIMAHFLYTWRRRVL